MYKFFKIGVILVLVGVLALIRFYEDRIFYDPLICFFKADYLNNNIPVFETGKLMLNVFIRYWMNSIISLGILYVAFLNTNILKFSAFLYLLFFVVSFAVFSFFISNIEQKHFLSLFYVRRFLIHPLLVIILLPAFYYHRLKTEQNRHNL